MVFKLVYGLEEIIKLGIDGTQAKMGVAELVKSLGKYNIAVENITETTLKFNEKNQQTLLTVKLVDEQNRKLTKTFNLTGEAMATTSVKIAQAENAYQRLQKAQREEDAEQRRIIAAKARRDSEVRSQFKRWESERIAGEKRMAAEQKRLAKEEEARRKKELAEKEAALKTLEAKYKSIQKKQAEGFREDAERHKQAVALRKQMLKAQDEVERKRLARVKQVEAAEKKRDAEVRAQFKKWESERIAGEKRVAAEQKRLAKEEKQRQKKELAEKEAALKILEAKYKGIQKKQAEGFRQDAERQKQAVAYQKQLAKVQDDVAKRQLNQLKQVEAAEKKRVAYRKQLLAAQDKEASKQVQKLRLAQEAEKKRLAYQQRLLRLQKEERKEQERVAKAALKTAEIKRRSSFGFGFNSALARSGSGRGLTRAGLSIAGNVGNGGSNDALVGGIIGGLSATALIHLTTKLSQLPRMLFDAAKESAEFNRNLIETLAIAGEGFPKIEGLSRRIEKLAGVYAKSRSEILEATYQTLSNQVATGAGVFDFVSAAADLNVLQPSAGVKDVVNAASSIIKSYGIAASEVTEINAALFKSMELGRFRISEVGNRFGRATFSAKALGVSYKELVSGMALLTRSGIPVGESMTLLVNLFNQMIKPSKELKKLFAEWGVETGRQAVELYGLGGVLERITEATRGNSAELAKVFPELRAFRGASALASNGAAEFEEILKQVEGGLESYTKKVKEAKKATGFEFQQAVSKAESSLGVFKDTFLEFANAAQKGLGVSKYLDDTTASLQHLRLMARGLNADTTDEIKSFAEELTKLNGTELFKEFGENDPSNPLNYGIKFLKKSADALKRARENVIKGEDADSLKDYLEERKELINRWAADTRKYANRQRELNNEMLEQERESFKARFEVQLSSYKKRVQLIEKEIREKRKFLVDEEDYQNTLSDLRKKEYKEGESIDEKRSSILDKFFGQGTGRAVFGDPEKRAINELAKMRAEMEAAFKANDFNKFEKASDAAESILKAQQNSILKELGSVSKSELNDPGTRASFFKYLGAVKAIQEQINQLRRQELDVSRKIGDQKGREADELQQKADKQKQTVKEINSLQKRLLRLDPSEFDSTESGLKKFRELSSSLVDKSISLDPTDNKTSLLLLEVEAAFRKQLQEQENFRELSDALNQYNDDTARNINKFGENIDKFGDSTKKYTEAVSKAISRFGAPESGGILERLRQIDTNIKTLADPLRLKVQALTDPDARKRYKKLRSVEYREFGGMMPKGTDTIATMTSPGEFITRAKMVDKFLPELVAINAGNSPRVFNNNNQNTSFGNIYVNVHSNGSVDSDVREIGYRIKREMRRQTLRMN